MIFISSIDEEFPYSEAEILYEENRAYLKETEHLDFKTVLNHANGNMWAIIVNDLFIGIIYFSQIGEKWFLSGFSKRKVKKYVSEAINRLCELYYEHWKISEIYAETPHKHAKSALLNAGFKEISQNLYRRLKNVK